MATKFADAELLATPIGDLIDSLPRSPESASKDLEDAIAIHDEIISLLNDLRLPEALSEAHKHRHRLTAKLPAPLKNTILKRYAPLAAASQRWEILDTSFDLKHRSWLAGLEAVYLMKVVTGQAISDSGNYGLALSHSLQALFLSPHDGMGIRNVIISQLMLTGQDIAAKSLAEIYNPDINEEIEAGEEARKPKKSLGALRREPWHDVFALCRDEAPGWKDNLEALIAKDPHVADWICRDAQYIHRPGDDWGAANSAMPMTFAWRKFPLACDIMQKAVIKAKLTELKKLGTDFSLQFELTAKALLYFDPDYDLPFPSPENLWVLSRALYNQRYHRLKGSLSQDEMEYMTNIALACRTYLDINHPGICAGYVDDIINHGK